MNKDLEMFFQRLFFMILFWNGFDAHKLITIGEYFSPKLSLKMEKIEFTTRDLLFIKKFPIFFKKKI